MKCNFWFLYHSQKLRHSNFIWCWALSIFPSIEIPPWCYPYVWYKHYFCFIVIFEKALSCTAYYCNPNWCSRSVAFTAKNTMSRTTTVTDLFSMRYFPREICLVYFWSIVVFNGVSWIPVLSRLLWKVSQHLFSTSFTQSATVFNLVSSIRSIDRPCLGSFRF